jgi:hypothetical protein
VERALCRVGSVDLGAIAGQRWWHIDEFRDIESAKKAATPQSYVGMIFGRAQATVICPIYRTSSKARFSCNASAT